MDNKQSIKTFINLACVGLLSSVILDSVLWVVKNYRIPSWTIAVMSFNFIVVLQALKRTMHSHA